MPDERALACVAFIGYGMLLDGPRKIVALNPLNPEP